MAFWAYCYHFRATYVRPAFKYNVYPLNQPAPIDKRALSGEKEREESVENSRALEI